MVDTRLFNDWVLTAKDDEGVRVYKPKRASLGKNETREEGLEIQPDGKIIQYELSPTGRQIRYAGTYEVEGNALYTHFKNHYLDSIFTILELSDDTLRIS